MTPEEKRKQQALAQIEAWNAGNFKAAAPYRYGAVLAPPRPRQRVQQRGKGGTLTSLISEAGGVGGAATGAAIGTALLPGVGTLAGAIIGGFAGGTGGRVAENKIRDNRVGLGDALKEGTVAGALSALGPATQLARGAKGAKALSSALPESKVRIPPQTTAPIGGLEKKGLGLTSKAGGYYVGVDAPGMQALTPSKVKRYDDLLRKLKIGANDSADLSMQVEQRLGQIGKTLEQNVQRSNVPVNGKVFATQVMKKIDNTPGIADETLKFARRQTNLLAKKKDAKSLLAFRRELDSFINQNANPDAAVGGQQAVARIIRGETKNKLNSLLPGFKAENNLYHDLSDIQNLSLRAAKRVGSESTSNAGGLMSRVLTSPTANTAKAKFGSAVQSVGERTAGTGGQRLQLARYGKLQAPGNVVEAMATPPPPQPDTPDIDPITGQPVQEQPIDDAFDVQAGNLSDNEITNGMVENGQLPPDQAELYGQSQGPATLEDALLQAQSILGPGQTPATYLSYAKAIQASNKGAKPNATQQKTENALRNATNVIDEVENAYMTVGGAQGAVQGTARNLAGKVRLDQDANYYNSQRQGYLSRIARAFGEVGTLSDQDIARAVNLIPDLADTPQNAARKLAGLRSLLAQAQQNNSGGSGNQDIVEALLQAQGGY